MRPAPLDFDSLHAALRAAGEGTRLRVLALLAEADLTVSDLTKILRQSQPRISRHLKLLAEAGLVDRFREGSWAFYRLGERGGVADIAQMLIGAARSGRSGRAARSRPARGGARRACRRRANLFQPARRRVGPHPPPARHRRGGRGRDPDRARRPADPLAARSRHRHRPHARTVRPRHRARARHRHVARHAGARARAAGARRAEALQRAPGRHLRTAGAEGLLRRRGGPSGAALPRRRRARDRRSRAHAAPAGPAAGGRFRAARSGIPARGARASASRLHARDRRAMDEARRASTWRCIARCRRSRARTERSPCRSGSRAIRGSRLVSSAQGVA